MKRDPSIEQLLRGDLLAVSPLNFDDGRDVMLEALFDLLPAFTQRHPTDPGIALLEALAAVLEIFGFYHDRMLTESKVGSAQLLRSVALLGDVVGYTPRPALAAVTHQFFEARTLGVIAAGSKLSARVADSPAKVIFETLHALPIGPAFNRMAFDPIIARHAGALRAVIRRIADSVRDRVTPLDEFPAGALTMINGITGLELTPIAGARTRAIAVARALRRSYGLRDTRVHCATEYRRLRNGHPLVTPTEPPELPPPEAHDDLMVFEVTARPILHIPEPTPRRLRSTLEVFVFDREVADPNDWPAEQRWQEVVDFSASEASDRHYRTFVDDRLHTYIIVRRRLGYRQLLSEAQLDNIHVRFTPAVGDIRETYPEPGPYKISKHLARLDSDYFTTPIVIPKVDGEPVRVFPSLWAVTDKTLGLIPGRQIIIENADTGEKYVRTLGPYTLDQYLNWRHSWNPGEWHVDVVPPVPRPLWDRIADDIVNNAALFEERWKKGLFLQTFGHYFPLSLPRYAATGEPSPPGAPISYPVLPGIGAAHSIKDALLFVEDIPDRNQPVPGWSERTALSISPLRDAAKAGPYHLWEQFYRHFENLDWRLLNTHQALIKFLVTDPEIEQYDYTEDFEENPFFPDGFGYEDEQLPEPLPDPLPLATEQFQKLRKAWFDLINVPPDDNDDPSDDQDHDNRLTRSIVIVPRGATYIIVEDSSRIGPGDYFLLGKRLRFYTGEDGGYPPGPQGPVVIGDNLVSFATRSFVPRSGPSDTIDTSIRVESFDPHWMTAEVLQAVEVHGRIVRLKWPTQNQYTVDFKPVTETPSAEFPLDQPVTELIIVPQVASVFFGETFSQELTLSPSRVLLANHPPETSKQYNIITIEKPFGRKRLRKKTGWTALPEGEDPNPLNDWGDVFLANFLDGKVWPVFKTPAITPPVALVWHGYVFIRSDLADEGLKWKKVVWLKDPTTKNQVDSALGPSLDGLTLQDEDEKPAYDVGPSGLKAFGAGFPDDQTREFWVQPADDQILYTEDQFTILGDQYLKVSRKAVLIPGTLVQLIPGNVVAVIKEGSNDSVFRIGSPNNPNTNHTDYEQFRVLAVNATRGDKLRAKVTLAAQGLTSEEEADSPLFVPGTVLGANADPSAETPTSETLVNNGRLLDEDHCLYQATMNEGETAALKAVLARVDDQTSYTSFRNQVDQLDKASYAAIGDDEFADKNNFFRRGKAWIKYLMLTPNSSIDKGKYALFSKKKYAAFQDGNGEEPEYPGVHGSLGEKSKVQLQTLTDSIIFNSGNFIPIRFGDPTFDHQVVANSLRIKLAMVNNGFEVVQKKVYYEADLVTALQDGVPIDKGNLFNFGKTPEGVFTLNFVFHGYFPAAVNSANIVIDVIYTAEPYHAENDPDREFDNKDEEGGDGDNADQDDVLVVKEPWVHYANYSFCPDDPVRWKEARFYQFETRPLPWNPLRQLILLNAGDLKAGDYLFIDPSGVEAESDGPCVATAHKGPPEPAVDVEASEVEQARDLIQWTRVVEVDGRMVMVDPYVKIQPRGFYHYRVTGYRRPATAAVPDEDYYALLSSEDKAESEAERGLEDETADDKKNLAKLSFRDRLMLRPFTAVQADEDSLRPVERTWLLDHLVPGDRLLVWDRRWQDAWKDYRASGEDSSPDRHWWAWPDYQHEVVIKRIVPHLGIVDIERRMPVRFGVDYATTGVFPGSRTFTSILAFEALMFYREPFQGRRELLAIGDGDRRVKFARFTSNLDVEHGLGSLALDQPGTVASNVEVLTFDGADGAWTRWVEFADIDRAKRKDRAFILGLETPDPADITVCRKDLFPETPEPATDEDCCCPDEDGPEDLPLGQPSAVKDPRIALSVSFGDGVKGELLPTGRDNVFIRPVEIGVWCKHFLQRPYRQILSIDHDCIPFRVEPPLASPRNIVLVAEHGAHLHWRSREGASSWPSSVVVEIDVADILDDPQYADSIILTIAARHGSEPRGKIVLHEVTDEQARDGFDGVVLRPVRPGVVQLSVVMPTDLYHQFNAMGFSAAELLARIRVYEDLRVEQWRLDENFYAVALASDPTLNTGAGTILLGETEGLAERSLLAFGRSDADSGDVEIAEVLAVDHSTYSATLTRGLERVYSLERSFLHGNVVHAVQGNSERLILGSGDGATPELRLGLGNREPILHSTMQDGAVGELTPGVTVLVDDLPWTRVDSLEGRGPRERVYRLDIEASGKAFVCFGDGQSGAIPVAGLDNIVAVLRTGDGGRGNVPVGAVDRLLDGNLAVERTRNVTPGGGGKAADDVDQAREHLMTRSFTHGRVITRDDVLRAVLALGNVAQARIDPASSYAALRVIVALAGRQPAEKFVLAELQTRLQAVMPLAADCAVELVDVVQRPVHVVLEVTVNRGFFEGDVILGIEKAFSASDDGFFDLRRWPIGAPLRVGEIYEQVFTLPGVATARVRWLSTEVAPLDLPAKVPDILWPGPDEVLRCDSDRVDDPYRARGSFRVQVKRGGK